MTYSAASLAWAAREADRPHATREHRHALRMLAAVAQAREAAPIDPHMPDRAIRARADDRAGLMRREIEAITAPMGVQQAADWLRQRVADLGAAPFEWPGRADGLPPAPGELAPMYERAQCPQWWRRQLRRAVVRAREALGMQRGEIRAGKAGQLYCTDDAVTRRAERSAANAAMLEATKIEDDAGQVITLAQASAASVSNKAIRRGELMTRIRGCEEWAEAHGMAGLFTTNTCPSRFHPQTMHGGANPRHDGSTPRDAQLWLRDTWARARAKLDRAGVRWFGFRVAEPHHDGCPHWHMLLWCDPAQVDTLRGVLRAKWLREDADEPGAAEHRFKALAMERGGAAGYVAKYIAKNIDDAGAVAAEGHHDTDHLGQSDWVGIGKAQRVETWAAAHGIRQFQALGQPPVTVWRELRRIEAERTQGAAPEVRAAHEAVNRTGTRRACWRAYMAAQGGAMVGRDYAVRLLRDDEPGEPGRYGDPTPARVLGVVAASQPGVVVLSERRQWKTAGTWAAPVGQRGPAPIEGISGRFAGPAFPRTRVNNCTRAGGPAFLMTCGLVGLRNRTEARGGADRNQNEHFPDLSGRQDQRRDQRPPR